MSFVKYRVKEGATDFGISPKEVSEIIGKYMEKLGISLFVGLNILRLIIYPF